MQILFRKPEANLFPIWAWSGFADGSQAGTPATGTAQEAVDAYIALLQGNRTFCRKLTVSIQRLSKSGREPDFVSENDFRYHLSRISEPGERDLLFPLFFPNQKIIRTSVMIVRLRLLLLASSMALITACGGGGGSLIQLGGCARWIQRSNKYRFVHFDDK